MKLWIGGEISADIGDAFRETRKVVEEAINSVIEAATYRVKLNAWDCIAIIRDDDAFEEIFRYSKGKKDMDFRLRLDHGKFKAAGSLVRQAMLVEMLLSSLSILRERFLSEEGISDLIEDVQSLARGKGWLAKGIG
jgi:hypothetical protein